MLTAVRGKEETGLLEAVEMVIYKTFNNGDSEVTNVPHKIKSNANKVRGSRVVEEYLPYEVFGELSSIFEFMDRYQLKSIDYHNFVSNKKQDMSFVERKENANSYISREDIDAVTDYLMNEWIGKHYNKKRRLNTLKNGGPSKDGKIQEITEWLDFFYSMLNELSSVHKSIIEHKFLMLEEDGLYPLDDLVYGELHFGRTYYYKHKKESMYLLGLKLLDNDILQ